MKQFKEFIKENNINGCKNLISKGCDVNSRSSTRWTPLMCACHYGKLKIVDLLLKQPKIKVNDQNDSGRTALMIACHDGYVEIVKLLLDCRDIDLTIENKDGESVFSLCKREEIKELIQIKLDKQHEALPSSDTRPSTSSAFSKANEILQSDLEVKDDLIKTLNQDILALKSELEYTNNKM